MNPRSIPAFLVLSASSLGLHTAAHAQSPVDAQPLAAEPAVTSEPVAEPVTEPVAEPAAAEPERDADRPHRVEAEFGEGVRFRADDFSLQIRARMQLQGGFSMPSRAAADAQGEDIDVTTNFQARRVRLVLTGHALTEELKYYFQLGFSFRDMESDRLVAVRDAYMTWQPTRDFGLRWGQMKVPYGLQRVVSSSALQMVDRSVVTAEFNMDRDVGIYALSEDLGGFGNKLQYQVGVFGGRGRNRFDGVDEAVFVGRVQVNPFGRFDHLNEGDMSRSSDPRLSIGLGSAYHFNGVRTRSTHGGTFSFANFDTLHLAADLHFKMSGFTFMSEFFYRSTNTPNVQRQDPDDATITQVEYAREGMGYYLQAAYMLPSMVEFSARFGEVMSDVEALEDGTPAGSIYESTSAGGAMGDEREAGLGLSYYIRKHALKLQADYFRIWEPGNVEDDRHQVRVQTQIYF